jgi:hypothetical protein
LVERSLVEFHFEANWTLVESDFNRREFGMVQFWCKQDFFRDDAPFIFINAEP